MFKVNDVIIYGAQGVCKIIGTEEKNITGEKKIYFVLQPVNDKNATIYAPMDNALVLKKMRNKQRIRDTVTAFGFGSID